jgi:hypothetical protein
MENACASTDDLPHQQDDISAEIRAHCYNTEQHAEVYQLRAQLGKSLGSPSRKILLQMQQ